jgi:hypothetical protein
MVPSTNPSRSSPNLQNFIDVAFSFVNAGPHAGAVQMLRIVEDPGHERIHATVRLGERVMA